MTAAARKLATPATSRQLRRWLTVNGWVQVGKTRHGWGFRKNDVVVACYDINVMEVEILVRPERNPAGWQIRLRRAPLVLLAAAIQAAEPHAEAGRGAE